MQEIIFKTRPRLFLICSYFLGLIFFVLLFMLVWQTNILNVITFAFLLLFAAIALTLLFYLFRIKTVQLTKDKIVISYFIFPIKKAFSLTDILSISQKSKKIEAVVGPASFRKSYIYNNLITTLTLSDKKEIRFNSIGQADFNELESLIFKLKRGEGKIKIPDSKNRLILYILDNVDGIIWIILLLILTIGLTYGVLIH